jgi:hypothetical protein
MRLPALILLAIAILGLVLIPASRSEVRAQPADGRPSQQVLVPPEPQVHPSIAAAGDYLSPVYQAPRPFTHMLVRREAGVPAGAALTLYVRASVDGASWGDWVELLENDDLWSESDGSDVAWSQTIDAGALAGYWQLRSHAVPSAEGGMPALRRVEVNTVDSTGPAPASPPLAAAGAAALAKPGVVSRTQWGSPDGQGSRVAPSYYPVNHMVVHHTADSSNLLPGESGWAARVRAEWTFHTYTRGWGDVGYNYLIDPNGVIYEGRAGGDDAVAFHDTANYGSMGVVLIGTYSSSPPTAAAQDALVRLLAWKAAQKHIDPLGRSYYYGCDISSYCRPFNAGAVVLNIAAHRQVTPGHTTCPGDQAVTTLLSIRSRVKQALSGATSASNGDLTIDDLESGFDRSPVDWHEASCGYGGHTFWTYASDGAPENSATWRPSIPSTGTYRVYAHIPQGCGLAPPPYASTKAVYRIHSAQGDVNVTVDHNTATEWVDLGAYTFSQDNSGAVELYDNTGEPLSAGRVLFFDAVKWVPESSSASVQLTSVKYDRTQLASGDLLKVTFTVKNNGDTTLYSQEPRVDPTAGGGLGGVDNGYVYDQDECFAGNSSGSYPSFQKESDRLRLTLGFDGWDGGHGQSCVGATGDNPWRWGLSADLAPGATQTIVGYVRFRTPGSYNLRAGLIQEYVKYFDQGVSPATIGVANEQIAPVAAAYDGGLQPLARVYRLGGIPDNFLARTSNPLSIPRGQYIGSFAWDGAPTDWGAGGPLGQTDQFLVEQTRSFIVPAGGTYTFRTTSDDGSWLWVDGQAVVINSGLHAAKDDNGSYIFVTGQITLSPGPHVASFKYFDRTGLAAAGYQMQAPGEAGFRTLPDGLTGGAARLGSTFIENPRPQIAADDQGGAGADHIHWSWDGNIWQDTPGGLLDLGKLANGSYTVRYQAVDSAGNTGDMQQLSFTVNTDLPVRRVYAPLVSK